jgi:hypothetical protein
MDQATLAGPDIDTGRDIVAVLDGANLKNMSALLAVFPEYGEWKLVVSSPSLDQSDPLKAYEEVFRALHGRFKYTLPPIMVLPTKDPFIKELRRIFGKAGDVTGMRLGGQKIGNRFLDNAYVYRIQ